MCPYGTGFFDALLIEETFVPVFLISFTDLLTYVFPQNYRNPA